MNAEEQINFRVNFSNATTPGGRQFDVDGNEIASIPIQLPNNLWDRSQPPPGRVEMKLAKMSLPLGKVSVTHIPLDEIVVNDDNVDINTRGRLTLWPFYFDGHGNIQGGGYTPPIFDPDSSSAIHRNIWPIQILRYTISGERNSAHFQNQVNEIAREKMIYFSSLDDLTDIFDEALMRLYHNILQNWGEDPLNQQCNANMPQLCFKNGKSYIIYRNYGSRYYIVPYSYDIFPLWNVTPFTGRVLGYSTDPNGVIQDFTLSCDTGYCIPVSIVVNRYIRDLFPTLPWVPVDNSKLTTFDFTNNGQSIPYWEDSNFGDSIFYVLDTRQSQVTFKDNDVIARGYFDDNVYWHSTTLEYEFNVNPLSFIDISSFVVVADGVSMTQQSFPVNVNPLNNSSALTTSIPIIETFLPLWSTIDDVTTSMLVAKDDFSNAAPIVVDPHILYERNIRLTVYYVTNDGKMHPVKIPANSTLSFQLCFCLTYY